MPTLQRRRRPAARLVPARDRGLLGRRRAGRAATRSSASARCCSPSTRRSPVAQEAAEWGADLLVVHHPLFLKPVHGVAATTPKGRTLGDARRRRLRAADRAHQRRPGGRRGVRGAGHGARADRPGADRAAAGTEPLDKLDVYVPVGGRRRACAQALAAAGAGGSATTTARRSRPRARAGSGRSTGADPTIGEVGRARGRRRGADRGGAARARRRPVVAAMLAAHPYEEPAYDVVELADPGTAATGTGRIGTVERDHAGGASPRRWRARCRRPRTASGSAATPTGSVRRVAVCGGAGDFLLDAVRAHRRRRLRDQRPAAPPGERVPRAGRAGAGRRRALGGRVDLAAGGGGAAGARRWAIRWRPG